jgi:hypothetical protein
MDVSALNGALLPPPRRFTENNYSSNAVASFNQSLQQQMQYGSLPGAVTAVGGTGSAPGNFSNLDQNSFSAGSLLGKPGLYPTYGSLAYGSVSANGLPANIEWPEGQDVSQWPVTVQLKMKGISGNKISWDETGDRANWPNEGGANANAWIIRETSSGQYKAETWDYLRPNQTTKLTENIVNEYHPRSGERVGIMLAGITRDSDHRNIEARSNVDWITWP